MKSILIVTRHTPLPWEDGAGSYLHDMARFLARRGFQVDVLWLAPHDHLRWGKIWRLPTMFDPGVRLHLPEGIRSGRRFLFPNIVWLPFKANVMDRARRTLKTVGLNPRRRTTRAVSIAAPASRPWASPPTVSELSVVLRFAQNLRPHVVIASYAWMCPILDLPALQGTRRVCLAHDVGWKRAALSRPSSGVAIAPDFTREDESAWLRRADVIIAISDADAVELRDLAPAAAVLVAPKALEARVPFAESDSDRLLFVGSGNAFNVEGLAWFLRHVWPLVRRDIPRATLDVCGSVNRAAMPPAEGVTFHGVVDRLDPFYQRAAIAIVPLLRATGLNIKLIDAAAFGRAIVATPITLVGAPFLRDAAITAESAEEFADAVSQLLLDPAARTAAASRVLAAVRTHLAPDACYGPLAALLDERR